MISFPRKLPLLTPVVLALTLLSGSGRAATSRPVAVVFGVSSYDPSTSVPALPQCEISARAIAAVLEKQAVTSLHLRRVTRQALLDAVRTSGGGCARDDLFLVVVVGAADRDGLLASDGHVRARALRQAIDESPARSKILCLDAGDGEEIARQIVGGDTVVLSSTSRDEQAWSTFFPSDDFVRFESAASHGWRRALERKAGEGWQGDLGNKDSLSVEDLRMCGQADAEHAITAREGRRVLDVGLGMRVLSAVRPLAARRLRGGGEVRIDDLRRDLGEARFVQLAGVLHTLSTDDFATVDRPARRELQDALIRRAPLETLQLVHNILLRRHLLDTPSDPATRQWKRLVLSSRGPETIAIVQSATQRSILRGRAGLAVFGTSRYCRYRVPYGHYEGELSGKVSARLRMDLVGTFAAGDWEGEINGRWLRGEWQGTFDARNGKVEGRVLSKLQPRTYRAKAPGEKVWPAVFEGRVTEEGTVLSGAWRSAVPTLRGVDLPAEGRWRVRK